ncbi:hypothetical protein SAMN04490244_10380 [Tranquillimonas rosea]|uniref:Uncharacterized protein n=1 Tax=Tranquillimonas rosea TaxID=641238 RepID=A0A1H9S8J9_9RHOB|nr:hypothetical protein [Tranquillimonas rosea]SER81332.1 hypothetical protein SAMN04490244_10380 [Tranquillimonas rosea]
MTSTDTLEGRLLAQRKVLARIVATLAARPDGEALLEWLQDGAVLQDAQEDPGSLPGDAVAVEAALSDEMREILAATRRYRQE